MMTEGQAPRYVTAAEITRNFGMWQDRANQAPVVVTHHGRTRCVLLSADAYEAMSSHSGRAMEPGEQAAIEHTLLVERIDEGFLTLDPVLNLRQVNTLAVMMLGRSREMLEGLSLADVIPGIIGGPLEAQL